MVRKDAKARRKITPFGRAVQVIALASVLRPSSRQKKLCVLRVFAYKQKKFEDNKCGEMQGGKPRPRMSARLPALAFVQAQFSLLFQLGIAFFGMGGLYMLYATQKERPCYEYMETALGVIEHKDAKSDEYQASQGHKQHAPRGVVNSDFFHNSPFAFYWFSGVSLNRRIRAACRGCPAHGRRLPRCPVPVRVRTCGRGGCSRHCGRDSTRP